MPRRPRNYLQGYSYHIVQRGVNRTRTFFNAEDFELYLALWREKSHKYQLAVHAYCLMPNHIHFLVTPDLPDSISKTMKTVGSHYAALVNKKYERTGTLWEGRHYSSLVDSESYMLRCYRYIENNPARAGIVNQPGSYQWSSYGLNTRPDFQWLTPHPVFLSLSDDVNVRSNRYRQFFTHSVDEDERFITKASFANLPIATLKFVEQVEQRHGISLTLNKGGRPRSRQH